MMLFVLERVLLSSALLQIYRRLHTVSYMYTTAMRVISKKATGCNLSTVCDCLRPQELKVES